MKNISRIELLICIIAVALLALIIFLAVLPSNPQNISCGPHCSYVGADGHRITLHRNASAVDVSYADLRDFLAIDTTDQNLYVSGVFNCADFAEELFNHAEQSGIRAGYVSIFFADSEEHAINAFNTTDKGLVYIDAIGRESGTPILCSYIKSVNLQEGKVYQPSSVFPCQAVTWPTLGVVRSFSIQW